MPNHYRFVVSLIDLGRPDHGYFFGFAQTDGHLYAGVGQKGRLSIEVSARDDGVLHAFSQMFRRLAIEIKSRILGGIGPPFGPCAT